MKVSQSISSNDDKRNIFQIGGQKPSSISNFNFENMSQSQLDKLNIPINQIKGNNQMHKFFESKKKSYFDFFKQEDKPPIQNLNIFVNNINNNINSSNYKEPGLLNKITNEEISRKNKIENNNKNIISNNNDNIINNNNNNNIFNNYNNDILYKKDFYDNNLKDDLYNKKIYEYKNIQDIQNKNKIDNFNKILDIKSEQEIKKEKEEKNLEEKAKKTKQIIDEYFTLEKVLKDEQNLFFDDNYHVSQSHKFEQIPEESSNYIISKRVNFPKDIYDNIKFNENNDDDNYTVIFPPLNCIIFVQENKIYFFNYMNEFTYCYSELDKPIKKLLITIPKPGIFINDIKFIAICSMQGEIQLLTIGFKSVKDYIPIIHKTEFIFNFNETIVDMISTTNHRIFISTMNNKIYELKYDVKQSNYFNFLGAKNTFEAINRERPAFFGIFSDLKFIFKKNIEVICKLKVDDTRNILYAIKYTIPKGDNTVILDNVMHSSVLIFDLGIDGKEFAKIEEISQEDLADYNSSIFNYNDSEDNILIQKKNTIIDIVPLTRNKFKDYHLLIIKRNGSKIFVKFSTYKNDIYIQNEEKILILNNSAFCRERITDRFTITIKQIPIKNNKQILCNIVNYFPFSTFYYFKNDDNVNEYILNVVDDSFGRVAKLENIKYKFHSDGLKEKEQLIFKTNFKEKKLYSIINLTDYNLNDNYNLGHLLKPSSKNIFVSNNINYLDQDNDSIISYNCMHDYAKQLFSSPEEIGMLFSDEFIIYKKLRPIDTLIDIMLSKNIPQNIINDKDNSYENKLNNPFRLNKEELSSERLRLFIKEQGFIETTVMIINIICNSTFSYYSKDNLLEKNINNKNDIMLNIKDFQYYLNPYSLTTNTNDPHLMDLAKNYIYKLFLCAHEEFNNLIYDYQVLLKNLNDKNIFANRINNNNYNFRINNPEEIKKERKNVIEFIDAKNFISYGLILFLSRIIRLFWEENIFTRNKLYLQSDNFDYTISNNLNQNQIIFINNILTQFINFLNNKKMDILQKGTDLLRKSNELKNMLNIVEQIMNTNSGFEINEVKRILSKNSQDTLSNHKKVYNFISSIFNFEKFNNDIEKIINIAKRLKEILILLDNIYKINITKELHKRKCFSIMKLKIKDIFKGNYPFVINEILQIIFDIYSKEKNMESASMKLNELLTLCPNIISKKDANAIEGNYILRYCNNSDVDNIEIVKYKKEALEKINLSLLTIKIKEVTNYLSKFDDLENIISLCLKKGKLLAPEINSTLEHKNYFDKFINKEQTLFGQNEENDTENEYDKYINNNNDNVDNKKDINVLKREKDEEEFYKCIEIILDFLNILQKSIVYDSFENYINITSQNRNIFSFPMYITNLLTNRVTEEYINMENLILNLAFKEDYQFIHIYIIDFLKANDLMDKLQEIKSKPVEKYLEEQIMQNNKSPQSQFSMYNYYFKNKNYPAATKILANLINYKNEENNIILLENEEQRIDFNNVVRLDDRISYVNLMLQTLELQIKDSEYYRLPEDKKREIEDAKLLREKMIQVKNILNIQKEIKGFLSAYISNAINNNYSEDGLFDYHEAIQKLDFEFYQLNELYNNFAKKFLIFDSCMTIYFHIKFSNTNNKLDPKEIKRTYCNNFCKLNENDLYNNWPDINFQRFDRIFNILIKEKTQYQNFYNMLQSNGMKNRFKDIIPLEFIIAIVESINRKFIFNNKNNNGDNYIVLLKASYKQKDNPFWLILYLIEEVHLPISYIFNEYYIIYLSLNKEKMKENYNLIDDNSSNADGNSSMYSIESNNFNMLNNVNNEEYGMVFDGNLNYIQGKRLDIETKFYCLFLLLGIQRIWVDKINGILDNSIELEPNRKAQNEFDFKIFNNENAKKSIKMKNIIEEYYKELNNSCNLFFTEEKKEVLKKYCQYIENEYIVTSKRMNEYLEEKNKFYPRTHDKVVKVNFIGEQNKDNNNYPFTNPSYKKDKTGIFFGIK